MGTGSIIDTPLGKVHVDLRTVKGFPALAERDLYHRKLKPRIFSPQMVHYQRYGLYHCVYERVGPTPPCSAILQSSIALKPSSLKQPFTAKVVQKTPSNKMQITNIYLITAIAIVGGALFGFDVASLSALCAKPHNSSGV